jgi:membrane protease YdiL (CAAX protease family)
LVTDFVATVLIGVALAPLVLKYKIVSLLVGLAMTALGGYVAGAIAGRRSLAHAFWVGVLSTATGLVLNRLFKASDPAWYTVLAYGLTIPAALLGGYLHRRYGRSTLRTVEPRPDAYPGFWQAVRLLALLALIYMGFGLGTAYLLDTFAAALPVRILLALTLFVLVYAVVLLWGARRAQAASREVFPLHGVAATVLATIVPTVVSASILLSELVNRFNRMVRLPPVRTDQAILLGDGTTALLVTALFIVILIPVVEELLFRGLILRGFMIRYGVRKAIIGSAVLFGLIHLHPVQAAGAGLLGLLFGWWRVRTGSLVPGLVGHAVYNAVPVAIKAFHTSIPGLTFDGTAHFLPAWLTATGAVLLLLGLWLLVRVLPADAGRAA